jgi:mRNA-degrading endonuclease toxin of MazEF toxin-antitoxin module
MTIQRGQVYFVVLDPVFGREMGGFKLRPVVVVSINDVHQKGLPVTVVPGTSDKGKSAGFRNVVTIQPDARNRLTNVTNFMCFHARAVDQGRFTQGPIGMLSPADLRRVEDAIIYNLGIIRD